MGFVSDLDRERHVCTLARLAGAAGGAYPGFALPCHAVEWPDQELVIDHALDGPRDQNGRSVRLVQALKTGRQVHIVAWKPAVSHRTRQYGRVGAPLETPRLHAPMHV